MFCSQCIPWVLLKKTVLAGSAHSAVKPWMEEVFIRNNFLIFFYPALSELSVPVESDDFLSELDCSHIMNITGNIRNVAFGIFLFISSQPAPRKADVLYRTEG